MIKNRLDGLVDKFDGVVTWGYNCLMNKVMEIVLMVKKYSEVLLDDLRQEKHSGNLDNWIIHFSLLLIGSL